MAGPIILEVTATIWPFMVFFTGKEMKTSRGHHPNNHLLISSATFSTFYVTNKIFAAMFR
jgi:hypothetical protein